MKNIFKPTLFLIGLLVTSAIFSSATSVADEPPSREVESGAAACIAQEIANNATFTLSESLRNIRHWIQYPSIHRSTAMCAYIGMIKGANLGMGYSIPLSLRESFAHNSNVQSLILFGLCNGQERELTAPGRYESRLTTILNAVDGVISNAYDAVHLMSAGVCPAAGTILPLDGQRKLTQITLQLLESYEDSFNRLVAWMHSNSPYKTTASCAYIGTMLSISLQLAYMNSPADFQSSARNLRAHANTLFDICNGFSRLPVEEYRSSLLSNTLPYSTMGQELIFHGYLPVSGQLQSMNATMRDLKRSVLDRLLQY